MKGEMRENQKNQCFKPKKSNETDRKAKMQTQIVKPLTKYTNLKKIKQNRMHHKYSHRRFKQQKSYNKRMSSAQFHVCVCVCLL